jgi:hypothetical protein
MIVRGIVTALLLHLFCQFPRLPLVAARALSPW